MIIKCLGVQILESSRGAKHIFLVCCGYSGPSGIRVMFRAFFLFFLFVDYVYFSDSEPRGTELACFWLHLHFLETPSDWVLTFFSVFGFNLPIIS